MTGTEQVLLVAVVVVVLSWASYHPVVHQPFHCLARPTMSYLSFVVITETSVGVAAAAWAFDPSVAAAAA
jgi:hypothetical protein